MKNCQFTVIATLCALAFTIFNIPQASAQDNLGIGAAFGEAEVDQDKADATDSSFKLFLSFPHLDLACPTGAVFCGFEMGYIDFGSLPTDIVFIPAADSETSEAQALYVAIKTLGVSFSDKAGLHAKFGFAYSWADRTVVDGGITYSGTGETFDTLLGIGFQYALTREMNLHVNWESYIGVGGEATLESSTGFTSFESGGQDISLFEIGLSYRF